MFSLSSLLGGNAGQLGGGIQLQVGELLVPQGQGLVGDRCGFRGLSGRRGFLLRLPFKGVGGKEDSELGQGDRLLRGVDDSFQLGFQAHSAIGTSSIVPEVGESCARMEPLCRRDGCKKGVRDAPDALRIGAKRIQGVLVILVCEIMIRVFPLSSLEFLVILTSTNSCWLILRRTVVLPNKLITLAAEPNLSL